MPATDSGSSTGAILRQALVEKIARNPRYSLRAFARDLQVSHSYLSMVLHGKRKLPFPRAVRFAELAGLDEEKMERLLACSREAALVPMHPLQRKRRVNPPTPVALSHYRVELDRFRVVSDWYHLAILDLTLIKGFKPQTSWVARRLGLSTRQVRTAVARLERLGLLEIRRTGRDRAWVKTHARLEVPTMHADRAILSFHEQMIHKAIEAARSDEPGAYEARDVTGITMPINPARLAGAKARIKRFRWSLFRYLAQGECTDLYQLNLQLFPLYRRGAEPTKRRKS